MTQHPGPTAQSQPPTPEWQPTNPPAPAAPEEKRSWFARHTILTVVLGLILFFILAQAFNGSGDDETASPAAAPAPTAAEATEEEPAAEAPAEEPAPAQPGIGDAVRDGKFEFVVTGVEDGGAEIGNEFLSEKAQGRFQLLHITVTNIGDEAQMMFDSNQKVRDEQGRTFEVDSMAGIHLDDNDIWLEDINPGNTVTGTLVFDMPEGATPVEIELHDSAFSGGVRVSLK